MTVTKKAGVQAPQFAEATFDYHDIGTDGALQDVLNLPSGALVVGGAVAVTTAFNQAGTIEVGDVDDPDCYTATPVNGAAAGVTALTLNGVPVSGANQRTIGLSWTPSGEPPHTAPTAGAGRIWVLYAIEDAADYNLPSQII